MARYPSCSTGNHVNGHLFFLASRCSCHETDVVADHQGRTRGVNDVGSRARPRHEANGPREFETRRARKTTLLERPADVLRMLLAAASAARSTNVHTPGLDRTVTNRNTNNPRHPASPTCVLGALNCTPADCALWTRRYTISFPNQF